MLRENHHNTASGDSHGIRYSVHYSGRHGGATVDRGRDVAEWCRGPVQRRIPTVSKKSGAISGVFQGTLRWEHSTVQPSKPTRLYRATDIRYAGQLSVIHGNASGASAIARNFGRPVRHCNTVSCKRGCGKCSLHLAQRCFLLVSV